MRIDLREMDAVLLTVRRNTERHARIGPFLKESGLNVQWVYGKPTRNHHVGAQQMAVDTLRAIRCPVLWLEDDAEPIHYQPIIEAPNDAQVLYLGGHRGGASAHVQRSLRRHRLHEMLECAVPSPWLNTSMRPWRQKHRALYMDTEHRDWVRLLSMYGGHAIVWLDDSVREAMIAHITAAPRQHPYDWMLAQNQWRYRIYCLRKPMFYQRDGHNDSRTRGYAT